MINLIEKKYEFRKKLLTVHLKNLRDNTIIPKENEFSFKNGDIIYFQDNTKVIINAVKDFEDYLFTAMNIDVLVTSKAEFKKKCAVSIRLAQNGEDLKEAAGYMGSSITISHSKVEIVAFDERGAAQALYYLEDMMNMRKAPFLLCGNTKRKALFTPRMIHSGYGIDEFPNEHLAQIAHAGMDAILVFVKGVNKNARGFLDFNELIWRAEKYGIDVYAYSYLKSEKHPNDQGAEEYYEGTYGALFKACPGLKGVVLVGESVQFPSKDPNTSGTIENSNPSTIPSGKVAPGWWPCYDLPDWINMVKDIIRKYKSDADIVLWSYNWAKQDEKYRIALIDNLPTDISLLATYSRPDIVAFDGVKTFLADYTLSTAGPSNYFLSEAKAAKRRGIRFYAMSNTGGLTWDFGVIPYEPFPYQWESRYKGLLECKEKYGLCGLMESHHFGFYPSFVSEFAKYYYFESTNKQENILRDILAGHYGESNVDKVDKGLKIWSDAICEYVVEDVDQYGPLRIGPAYPLCLNRTFIPFESEHAHFGTGILRTEYNPYIKVVVPHTSFPTLRLNISIKQFEKMEKLILEGIKILNSVENPNYELQQLIDLGKYIKCCIRTTLNTKYFTTARTRMANSYDNDSIRKCILELKQICLEEINNAKEAIPLVRRNSRFGWEPSMEYLGDEEHIIWKIKQVEYVINVELEQYKNNLDNNP